MIDSTVQLVHPWPGAVVVALLGEHDRLEEERYDALFQRLVASNDLVVIDLSNARFIDSSLISTLFRCSRHAGALGTSFRVQISSASPVWRTLDLSGALDVLEIASTRDAALLTEGLGVPGPVGAA